MNNDPSTAITSATAPAPEVSDNISREGNVLPLPVTEGSTAPPAPDLVKKIGKTTYRVKVHFSAQKTLAVFPAQSRKGSSRCQN